MNNAGLPCKQNATRRPGRIVLAAAAAFAASLTAPAPGETSSAEIRFDHQGAVYQSYFDFASTGSVLVTVPAGLASSGPLELIHAPVASGDRATTVSWYDASSTFTATVAASQLQSGPNYLILRLPQAGLRGWTFANRLPSSGGNQEPEQAALGQLAEEYRLLARRRLDALFDEDTSGTWMGTEPHNDSHWIREDVYYAVTLLATDNPADHQRANATLQAMCAAQDRTSSNPGLRGLFYYNGTDRRVHHNTVNFFATPLLARLLIDLPPGLSPETREEIRVALEYSCQYLDHRFAIGYSLDHTNFQALGIAGLALSSRVLESPYLMGRARQQMQLWYDHALAYGASFEFNSPVYAGVTLWSLKLIMEESADSELIARARVLHERFWLDCALSHHPHTRHFAGPYSRAYRDLVYGGTTLAGILLSSETGLRNYVTPGRLAENYDSLHSHDLNPAWFEAMLQPAMSSELREIYTGLSLPAATFQRTRSGEMRSWLSSSFTLGSYSRSNSIGAEGFLIQVGEATAPGGVAPLFVRSGAAGTGNALYETPAGQNIATLQNGPNALLLASCLLPPSTPPNNRTLLALVADERFSTWHDIRINALPAAPPASFGLEHTIFMRRGGVFLAVRPLFAAAAGERSRAGVVQRGEGHLNIALHSVDSATTQVIAGTRLEAGFAVACAEAAEWPSYDGFISAFLSSSSVAIEQEATTRSISWNWNGSLSAVQDRDTGNLSQTLINNGPSPDLLLDAAYARQTTGSVLQLRDLQVEGLAPASWAVYPAGSSSALVVNPSGTTVTLTTNWYQEAVTAEPYGFLRLSRPPPARVEEWQRY